MKIIPGSRKHHYLAIVSIFLVAAILIVGMAGCDYDVTRYDLTISRTVGGSITTPGEGTFTYLANRTVNLVAEPHEHYHFAEWIGDVGTIADVEDANTTITMDDDYSIAASFELDEGWYSLTTFSTLGGSVTEPGEGIYVYAANTTVNLVAEPDEHCHFVNWTGDVDTIGNVTAAATNITMYESYYIMANFFGPQVAAGDWHTVGLKDDGTVIAVGYNHEGQCNVGNWTDIIQVAAGGHHTVGLKSDGSVVAVGLNSHGQCSEVDSWIDIIQVSAGYLQTVGLKSDGSVVAVGHDGDGQCSKVDSWMDIIQVASGGYHTVGLKPDGTVVVVGFDYYDWMEENCGWQCMVDSWMDITQVSAGNSPHTVGLKSDGTVVAVGQNHGEGCNVGNWTDIIQVDTSIYRTAGLKSDGTVVAVGYNDFGQCDVGDWTEIIQVATGCAHTVGLKSDGTVVAVGRNNHGQCDVGAWMLN